MTSPHPAILVLLLSCLLALWVPETAGVGMHANCVPEQEMVKPRLHKICSAMRAIMERNLNVGDYMTDKNKDSDSNFKREESKSNHAFLRFGR